MLLNTNILECREIRYQIVNFRILVVPFNKALVFWGFFWVVVQIMDIYPTFLISMIAGNLVEIRLPN
jgi:hypothetical protein